VEFWDRLVADEGFQHALLVGAPFDSNFENTKFASGQVFVFDAVNSSGGLLLPKGSVEQPSPEEEEALFGYSVAALPDIDGDGIGDFAVGAPFADGRKGAVYVFSGKFIPTGLPSGGGNYLLIRKIDNQTGNAEDRFGESIAFGGDVNNDAALDIVIGAPGADPPSGSGAGLVKVFSLFDFSLVSEYAGDGTNEELGTAVAPAGDLNGDGFDDIVAGAPGQGSSGSIHLLSGAGGGDGRLERLEATTIGPGARLGSSVTSTTPGQSWVFGGAPQHLSAKGAVVGFRFDGTTWHEDYLATGPGDGTSFGASVKMVLDLKGTAGTPDLMIGAPRETGSVSNAGACYFQGFDTGSAVGPLFRYGLLGARKDDRLGMALTAFDAGGQPRLCASVPFRDDFSVPDSPSADMGSVFTWDFVDFATPPPTIPIDGGIQPPNPLEARGRAVSNGHGWAIGEMSAEYPPGGGAGAVAANRVLIVGSPFHTMYGVDYQSGNVQRDVHPSDRSQLGQEGVGWSLARERDEQVGHLHGRGPAESRR